MERAKAFALRTVLVLFLFEGASCVLTTLKADISMSSVRGTVTFSKGTSNNKTEITFNLTGLTTNSVYTWNVHSFPVNYDTAERCSNATIGMSISPVVNGSMLIEPPPLVEADIAALLGRSIVLSKDDDPVACATILPDGVLTTAMVNFRSSIGGTIILRQPKDSEAAESIVYADLFFMHKMGNETLYNWEIRSNPVDESVPVQSRCENLGNLFGVSAENCGKQNQLSCPVGGLGSKLGPVKVAPRKGDARMVYSDVNLPLSGANSVLGKSVVILDLDNTILSCANIIAVKEKKVSVVFNKEGVTGSIHFSQKSPFDPTMVEVNLSGLNNSAGGYHVHDFPVPAKMDKTSSVCSGDAVSGHWNPFSIDKTGSPTAASGTSDQYEVGDLSGKYGTFNSKNSVSDKYMDWNLPLFGMNSIVGRSVVIHHDDDTGSRWICSNIGYPSRVRTGVVSFKHPVIGQMMFRQVEDDPFSDTSILIELNRADGLLKTVEHNFHVHINPIEDDLDVKASCALAIGHYNPFNVDVSGNYSSLCSPTSPFRCEIGDLSLKHKPLDIIASKTKSSKYFFTDSSLPLSGQLSIIGRSVVIHGAGKTSPRIACANIYEQTPMEAFVNEWSSGLVRGSLEFSQATSLDVTKVEVQLLVDGEGTSAEGYMYHIPLLPILPGAENPCSVSSIAGYFNPFNISNSPAPGTGTYDKYQVGNLGGKYGLLTDSRNLTGAFIDNNLQLRGRQSIIGRSVVFQKNVKNAQLICGNIKEKLSGKPSMVYKAQAIFKGDVQGSIMLSQVHYGDGNLGDTEVYISLAHADSSKTEGHPWHITEDPVSLGGDCQTAGATYNPYAVNATVGYDECHPLHPLRCKVGDVSGKHGTYHIGSGPRLYTDVNIPLSGKYSVLSRSIVIHSPDSTRIACADIMSMEAEVVQMQVTKPRPEFNKKDFMAAIANLLESQHWTIGVMVHVDDLKDVSDDCLKLSTYITGSDRESYKNKLLKYIAEEPGMLGIYAPCMAAASTFSMSISVLLFLLSVNWISR